MNYKKCLFLAALLATQGCHGPNSSSASSSDDAIAQNASLSNLPQVSATQLLFPNSEEVTRSSSFSSTTKLTNLPPPMFTIGSEHGNNGNVDQYVWNGLLAAIKNNNFIPTAEQKELFWGETIGGPGGYGTCQMMDQIGQSFRGANRSISITCPIMAAPRAPAGVTVDKGSLVTVFEPELNDKIVKIIIVAALHAQAIPPIYVKVYGTQSNGNETYKSDLWTCMGADSPLFLNTTLVNKNTGLLSEILTTVFSFPQPSSSEKSIAGERVSIDATLKRGQAGLFVIDSAKDRHISVKRLSPASPGFLESISKSDMTINSENQITDKFYSSRPYAFTQKSSFGSWENKNFFASTFVGSHLADFALLAGGTNGILTVDDGKSGAKSKSYLEGSEFQTTNYVSVDNDLKTAAGTMDLSTDPFYSVDEDMPSIASSYACDAIPTITMTIDLSNPIAARTIGTMCSGDKDSKQIDLDSYEPCSSFDIQQILKNAF